MKKLSITENPEKSNLTNTGSKQFVKLKLLSSIQTAEPFTTVFPINETLLETIVEDMRQRGFDNSQPLLIWKEREVVLDGHTRLKAAEKAGIQQVPVYEKPFESESEALEYVIHLQKDRRNLTDSELYACIMELDKRFFHGGDRQSDKFKRPDGLLSSTTQSKSSREKTAEVVGTSPKKVQKVRTIEDHGSEETKQAPSSGGMSINKAYNKTQEERKSKPEKTATKTTPDIEVYWNEFTLIVIKDSAKVEVLELKEGLDDQGKERIRKAVVSSYNG